MVVYSLQSRRHQRVFISYRRADALEAAREIKRRLEQEQSPLPVFLDEEFAEARQAIHGSAQGRARSGRDRHRSRQRLLEHGGRTAASPRPGRHSPS